MYTEERAQSREPVRAVALAPGRALRSYSRLRVWVALMDLVLLEFAIPAAWWLHRGFEPLPVRPVLLLVVAPFIYVTLFIAFRLYSLWTLSPAEEFRRVVTAVTLGVSALVVFAFWSRSRYSRLWIFLVWILSLAMVLTSRRIWHWWMGKQRAQGKLTFRTLLVGGNAEAGRFRDTLAFPGFGLLVVGQLTLNTTSPRLDDVPFLGTLDRLDDAIGETGAECLFVMSTAVGTDEVAHITRTARLRNVQVRMSANISNIMATRLSFQPLGKLMAFTMQPVRLTGIQAAMKRTMDLAISIVGLVLALPLLGAIAIAIKIDSRGPILYRQERVGLQGRRFSILKFRTMVVNAEDILESLRHLNEATGPLFKLRRDPRVTRVGKFLRRRSFDELPQLWNVVRGEMSMVGPRPPLPGEVALYEEWHMDRLEVRPGISGLWQVQGRSQLPFDDYVRLDLYYIENWSVAYDLYILAKTLPAIFSGKGAF
jgi:exopolysaccharide biosynthesis polyprenyl glycosylphosphotransferase